MCKICSIISLRVCPLLHEESVKEQEDILKKYAKDRNFLSLPENSCNFRKSKQFLGKRGFFGKVIIFNYK